MIKTLALAATLLCAGYVFPAFAQDQDLLAAQETATSADEIAPSAGNMADQSWLTLGVGYYDVLDGDDTATDLRVEYRHGDKLFWEIKPWGGVEATTDGSFWLGGGVLADFKVAQNIYLTPSFGAGLYAQGGSNKDLGSPLEFRTQLEGTYEFINGHRLGVALSHLSNAHLDDKNPGTEVLNLYYHVPIANLF